MTVYQESMNQEPRAVVSQVNEDEDYNDEIVPYVAEDPVEEDAEEIMDKVIDDMDKPREDFDHWLDNFEYGRHGRNLGSVLMSFSQSDYT